MYVRWKGPLEGCMRRCVRREGWPPRRKDVSRTQVGSGECYRVLGIESSCDDTGVAIVESGGAVVAEKLATQTQIHSPWGGVVPRLAQEAHQAAMDDLVCEALSETPFLDAVAVTVGPGLSLCLRVGVEAAMRLSAERGIPLIPIHHMEAHALVGRLTSDVTFPFLCLLVSGGHNLLLVAHGIGNYTQIGTTMDDSLGEAYDKVARMLDLELVPSGGAALEKEAERGDPLRYPFKLPMQKYPTCDFSYSGLKTSVRLTIEKEKQQHQDLMPQARADIAASFQHVAIRHLQDKCSRGIAWAMQNIPGLQKKFVVSGGVAANAAVRKQLERTVEEVGMQLLCPPPRLCTDNGVMVAWAGMERFLAGLYESSPVTMQEGEELWVDLRPRWPLTERLAFEHSNQRAPRRKRLHTSLTTMTEQGLPALTLLSTANASRHGEQSSTVMSS